MKKRHRNEFKLRIWGIKLSVKRKIKKGNNFHGKDCSKNQVNNQ